MDKPELLLKILNSDEDVGFDTETTGLKWQKDKTIGYSVSAGTPESSVYVATNHTGGGNISNPKAFTEAVARAINNRKKPLYVHNGKFDSHFSLLDGIDLGHKLKDTLIGANLLDENQKAYSLDYCASLHKDIPQKKGELLYAHIASLFGVPATRSSMGHFHRLAGDDILANDYAAGDTLTTYHLAQKQAPELYSQHLDYVYDLENKLVHVLRKMERRGIAIDMSRLARIKREVDESRVELYSKIPLKEDFSPINLNSNKDLQQYFLMHDVDEWNYTEPTERHPDGQPSFKKSFLAMSDPGRFLLQVKALDGLKQKFLDPIGDFIYSDTVYTNFNQSTGEYGRGTKTGRLSSNSPNMQQIPKRDRDLGRIFRSIFVARPGYTFVEFDYSQAEPRLFSHYSDEPVLLEGYNSTPPIDMHQIAANYMFPDMEPKAARNLAKNLNLGLQYTMGREKLAKSLGVSIEQATAIYYQWQQVFPNVKRFTKQASKVAETRGYVKTILGRRARFPDPTWAYKAANRIVQGGAADILKFMLVRVDDYLVDNHLEEEVRMLLNIHDSVLFEIRDEMLDIQIPKLAAIFEDTNGPPFSLKVPMVVDKEHMGKDWDICTYGGK